MRNTLLVVAICLTASVVFATAAQFQPLNVKTGLWRMTKTITWTDLPLESLALEEGKDLGRREAAIETHPQPCPREGRPQPRQQSRQDPDRADRGGGTCRAKRARRRICTVSAAMLPAPGPSAGA